MADLGIIFLQELDTPSTDTSQSYIFITGQYAVPLFLGHPV